MHPSVHYRFNEDDEFSENRVILAIILWQTLAACLISLRSHVLCGGRYVAVGSQPMHLNFPGLCLWNMILLVAVDMLVLPPILAFTRYFYYYYQIQQAHA